MVFSGFLLEGVQWLLVVFDGFSIVVCGFYSAFLMGF